MQKSIIHLHANLDSMLLLSPLLSSPASFAAEVVASLAENPFNEKKLFTMRKRGNESFQQKQYDYANGSWQFHNCTF